MSRGSGRRIITHAVLVAGGAVFSLPFFWLITTSFKADKEMFVLPPQWIPELPQRVVESPYERTWRDETSTQFFGLGAITVQDLSLSDYPVPGSTEQWRIVEPANHTAALDSFESRAILRVPYDWGETGRVVAEMSFASPVPPEDLRRIEVTYKSDRSFHRMRVHVASAAESWESAESSWLSTETWKSAPWQFTEPREEERSALRLRRSEPSDVALSHGENNMVVRVELVRTPWPVAVYRKYLENYYEALSYIPFGRFMLNTVAITALNIAFQLLSCSLIAYGFSRIRWPGRNAVFGLLLATMMIPGQVVMIPQFLIWKNLGLYNTWGPLVLPALFGAGFYIFLLRQFMLAIPRDLEDAAKIDGAGYFGTWRMVILPLIKPSLAAIAIFQFMGSWNDFFNPLLYINTKELMPISLGLYMFKSAHSAEFGMLMAASTVMVVPVVLLFFFAQRYFIQGVTLTGLKG